MARNVITAQASGTVSSRPRSRAARARSARSTVASLAARSTQLAKSAARVSTSPRPATQWNAARKSSMPDRHSSLAGSSLAVAVVSFNIRNRPISQSTWWRRASSPIPRSSRRSAPYWREGLEQVEPGLTLAGVRDDHGLVDQVAEEIEDVLVVHLRTRADRLGGREVEGPGEDGETVEQGLGRLVEQAVRPLDRGPQRLMALDSGPAPTGQQTEPLVEPRRRCRRGPSTGCGPRPARWRGGSRRGGGRCRPPPRGTRRRPRSSRRRTGPAGGRAGRRASRSARGRRSAGPATGSAGSPRRRRPVAHGWWRSVPRRGRPRGWHRPGRPRCPRRVRSCRGRRGGLATAGRRGGW